MLCCHALRWVGLGDGNAKLIWLRTFSCSGQVDRHKESLVTSLVVFVTFSMLRLKNDIYSVEFNVPFPLEMYSLLVNFLPVSQLEHCTRRVFDWRAHHLSMELLIVLLPGVLFLHRKMENKRTEKIGNMPLSTSIKEARRIWLVVQTFSRLAFYSLKNKFSIWVPCKAFLLLIALVSCKDVSCQILWDYFKMFIFIFYN